MAGAAVAGALSVRPRDQRAARAFRSSVLRPNGGGCSGPKRYEILREAGTERAFTSPLLNEHRRGAFVCAGCALPLFSSATKFESGTGWPSFWRPLPRAVVTRTDRSLGIGRTEVLCARCGGHLGHVFDDGPRPTGLRYCMNGLALRFRPA